MLTCAGPPGPAGTAGQNGSAIAYAYVESDGDVIEGLSKNVTDAVVTYAPACGYCFNLPFEVRNAVANTDATNSAGVAAVVVAQGDDVYGACSGEDVLVETRIPNSGAVAARSFYVLFN